MGTEKGRVVVIDFRPFFSPYFELEDPHPNRTGVLELAEFDWDFQLAVSVGTTDVDTEVRPLPPGDRYPFFRRAVSQWSFRGTITRNGSDLTLNSPGIEILSGWLEKQGGNLAFDEEVRRRAADGVPFKANNHRHASPRQLIPQARIARSSFVAYALWQLVVEEPAASAVPLMREL